MMLFSRYFLTTFFKKKIVELVRKVLHDKLKLFEEYVCVCVCVFIYNNGKFGT